MELIEEIVDETFSEARQKYQFLMEANGSAARGEGRHDVAQSVAAIDNGLGGALAAGDAVNEEGASASVVNENHHNHNRGHRRHRWESGVNNGEEEEDYQQEEDLLEDDNTITYDMYEKMVYENNDIIKWLAVDLQRVCQSAKLIL